MSATLATQAGRDQRRYSASLDPRPLDFMGQSQIFLPHEPVALSR
jgi:hypothetical protein